jgi:hypothetical protein
VSCQGVLDELADQLGVWVGVKCGGFRVWRSRVWEPAGCGAEQVRG